MDIHNDEIIFYLVLKNGYLGLEFDKDILSYYYKPATGTFFRLDNDDIYGEDTRKKIYEKNTNLKKADIENIISKMRNGYDIVEAKSIK